MRDGTPFGILPQHAAYGTFISAIASRSLVVFDLDNTLIHSIPKRIPSLRSFPVDTGEGTWLAHIRPHVYDFVKLLHQLDIPYAVWTAGDEAYAKDTVAGLKRYGTFCPKFVWARSKITIVNGSYVKDMRKIEGAVLLDDSAHHKHILDNEHRVQIVPAFDATRSKDTFFWVLSQITINVLRCVNGT